MITKIVKNKIISLSDLDDSILNSNLVLLSGIAGIGKTTFAINYSDYISQFVSKRVLYFTLEMDINQLEKCRNNYKELDYTEDSKLEIFDNILSFESLIKKIEEEKELSLVIIDYIQLLYLFDEKEEIKKENIDLMINQLKKLSEKLNFPIILLSHLSKFTNSDNIEKNIPSPKNLRLIDYKFFDLILMMYENTKDDSKNILIYDNDENIGELNFK